MKKIVKVSFFGIEKFIAKLHLPIEFEASLEEISKQVFGRDLSVFKLTTLSGDSPFHFCKFVKLRNEFDLFSGE